eukprot:11785-Heterocapsa_arctica.AAC.1
MNNWALLRGHSAAVQHCIIIDANNPIAQAMVTTGKKYSKTTHPQALEGTSHLHIWASLMQHIIANKLADSVDAAIIQAHAQAITSPLILEDEVYICTATNMYSDAKIKIIISTSHNLLRVTGAVLHTLQNQGGLLKDSAPPRFDSSSQCSATLGRTSLLLPVTNYYSSGLNF